MSLFYNVTMHKATQVLHGVLSYFTSSTEPNLILNHGSTLSVWSVASAVTDSSATASESAVLPLFEINIFGDVTDVHTIPSREDPSRHVLHVTAQNTFCLLRYNTERREVETVVSGSIRDPMALESDTPCMAIHKEAGVAVYHRSIGYVRVAPYASSSVESFLLPTDRDFVAMCALEGAKPDGSIWVCVVAKDGRQGGLGRQLLCFSLSITGKVLRQLPNLSIDNVEASASLLIPVHAYGVLMAGDNYAVFVQDGKETITVAFESAGANASIPEWPSRTCWAAVDVDTYVIGAISGRIHLLSIRDGSLTVRHLCTSSCPAAIVPLKMGCFFVGSRFSDSVVVSVAEEGNRVVDFLPNVGPVMDMVLVDIDGTGRNALLTCSNALKDASLRIVRSGIAMNSLGTLANLPGVRGMWSLRHAHPTESEHRYIVLSFVGGTVILSVGAGAVEQISTTGFDQGSSTVYAANVAEGDDSSNYYVQVTPTGARLITAPEGTCVNEFNGPAEYEISLASASGPFVVLAAGPRVCLVEVAGHVLNGVANMAMTTDVACVHLAPANIGTPLLAVGTWTDNTVSLLTVPGLAIVTHVTLAALPRSCLLHRFGDTMYLLSGQGNGSLCMWKISGHSETQSPVLSDQRTYAFGTKALTLHTHSESCVFVRGTSTSIFHFNGRRLILADVNVPDLEGIVPFDGAAMVPGRSVAMLTSSGDLQLGHMDSIQKLHVQSLPLSESPMKIGLHRASESVVLLTRRYPNVHYRDGKIRSDSADCVRVLERPTFEPKGSYLFDHQSYEMAISLYVGTLGDDPREYIVVGTAYARPEEVESKVGRIVVLHVEPDRSLHVVLEHEVKGAVYSMGFMKGRLLAGVANRVCVFKWVETPDGRKELQAECNGTNGIVPMALQAYPPDLVAVGDITRSMSLLRYNASIGTLEDVAHDYNPMWITHLRGIAEDMFVAFDKDSNFAVLRQNKDTAIEDDKRKLETVARYHCGEYVNVAVTGTLSVRNVAADDGEGDAIVVQCTHDPVIYAGAHGSLSMIIPISQPLFQFCNVLQRAILSVLQPPGNLKHDSWRSHANELRSVPSHGVVDGDVVELFADLAMDVKQSVVDAMNGEVPMGWKQYTVTEVMKKVDDLTRLHH